MQQILRERGRDPASQLENNHFTEMCSGSEAGSYSRLIDFVYHSTLGLRVIKKKDPDSRVSIRYYEKRIPITNTGNESGSIRH